MDERQRETDGDRTEPAREPLAGGTQNDQQEPGAENDLDHERSEEAVATRGEVTEPVGGKCTGLTRDDLEAVHPVGHDEQDPRSGNGADHLGDDVRKDLAALVLAGRCQAECHRRIEVSTRNVSERVGTAEHGEAEREGHTQEPDTQREPRVTVGEEVGSQHRASATPQHQPECAQELCCELPAHESLLFPSPHQRGAPERR